MGGVVQKKRAKRGKTRSKGQASDDSDEDYMVEEDEDYMVEEDADMLFSNDDEEDDDDKQYCSDSFNIDDEFEEKIEDYGEDEEMSKTIKSKRKRSGLIREKLGTRVSNKRRNAQRRDNDLTEELEVSEEEEDITHATKSKPKRTFLDRKKLRTKASENRRKQHREADDDYYVEEKEDEEEEDYYVDAKEEEEDDDDQNETFQVSEEQEEVKEVIRSTNRNCLDQKKLRTKGSNNRRNGHGEFDDEDYCIDEEEEEDVEEEFTLDESVSLVEEEDDEEEFTLDESVSLEEEEEDNEEEFTLDESVSLEEEEEEEDNEEEFTLDESFSLEEEEFDEEKELVVKKVQWTNKTSRRTPRKKSHVSRNKSTGTVRVPNRKVGKKGKRNSSSQRKLGSEDVEGGSDYENEVLIYNQARTERPKKKPGRGTRKFTVQSDSDFVDSAQSEAEFTISEEEREQVREASNSCGDMTVPLRSSCYEKIQENASIAQRKPFDRKGKKKIEEARNEVGKQMCGICFSEEGKNTVRGTLNCCSHFFCFTCILEWSKVESRCPLCKQRFMTISKPAKVSTGIDLRDVVLQVPERDQVYQPTEEEIRGYFDPYENVMCTECHEGGDDDLMLLCDLCDSPAHTYCVGLGRVVPEGNWYCEGCRPVSLGASNNQAWDSLIGQRNLFHRLSSFDGIGGNIDGSMSTQFPHGYGSFPSPMYFSGGQAPSPRSGTGVVTVSGRRQIHRHMQSMFGQRSRQATGALFDISASYSHANQSHSTQRTSPPTGRPVIGTSFYNNGIEESHDLPCPQNIQILPERSNHFEAQMALGLTPLPVDSNIQGTFIPSNISNNYQPFHLSNRRNVGSDYHLSSSTLGEGSNFFLEEQVKPLVQNYLTSMSITSSLGAGTVEEIERTSTKTVLAACGYQHHPDEVFPVPPQPLCTHVEYPSTHSSLINGRCDSCYANFVKEVVKTIINSRLPSFLRIRD